MGVWALAVRLQDPKNEGLDCGNDSLDPEDEALGPKNEVRSLKI